MLEVEKWAEGKPFLLALFAPQMVSLTQDLDKSLEQIQKRRLHNYQFPFPDLLSWFGLYRGHHKSNKFLEELLSDHSDLGPDNVELAKSFFEYFRTPKKDKLSEVQVDENDLLEAHAVLKDILDTSFNSLKSEFSGNKLDQETKKKFDAFFAKSSLEGSFFALVNFPCYILYRQHPTHLYRSARSGNVKSLKKLVSLDPLLLHDPYIGKAIQKIRLSKKSAQYWPILEATINSPKAKIENKTFKYSIAGYISAIAFLIKFKLTSTDIANLFHAVEKDVTKNPDAEDLDIPAAETFYKAVYRYRHTWLDSFRTKKP